MDMAKKTVSARESGRQLKEYLFGTSKEMKMLRRRAGIKARPKTATEAKKVAKAALKYSKRQASKAKARRILARSAKSLQTFLKTGCPCNKLIRKK